MTVLQASDLENFFLDDSKYTAGDHVGRALAATCQYCHLSFFWLLAVGYARRDLLDVACFLGAAVNAGLGKILKVTFRQQRPTTMCEVLGVCQSYGMPSSHTQVMAFCCALHLALSVFTWPPQPQSQAVKLLRGSEVAALLILTGATGFARVYLGYHTLLQVVFGSVVGGITGFFWGVLALYVLRRYGNTITGWPLARALGFANVLSASKSRPRRSSRAAGQHIY